MPKPRNSVVNGTSSKQDIRSFFLPKQQKNKPAPAPVDLSDDDVIPESPDVQVKAKKKERKKKRVLNDSSDEEIFTKKAKKSDEPTKVNSKGKKSDKPALKEVKAADLFGSGPIKRTEPIVKKEKKIKTETGIHSDEEFEKSLLELDSVEKSEDTRVDNNHAKEKEQNIQSNGKKRDKSSENTKTKEKVNETNKSKYFNGDSSTKSPEKSKNNDGNKQESNKEEKMSKNNGTDKKTDESINIPPTKDTTKDAKLTTDAKTESKNNKNDKSPNKKSHESPEKPKLTKTETKKSKIKESTLYTMEVVKSEKKRDFSEFVGDEEEKQGSGSKKKKHDLSLNASVVDEEKHEKKRHSAILYQNYMNRSGPKHLGAKEMPEGTADCLKECAFLLTGVLDSFEREEVAEAIAKYGGTVKSGVSKKVTHVVAGDDAGPAKLAKAKDLGITIMNEDEFLQLIIDKSAKKQKSTKPNTIKITEIKNENSKSHSQDRKDKDKKELNQSEGKNDTGSSESKSKKAKLSPEQMKSFEDKIKYSFYSKSKKEKSEGDGDSVDVKMESASSKESVRSDTVEGEPKREPSSVSLQAQPGSGNMMWVEKYKPQSVKQIIGQHGDASNVKKLTNWLSKWYVSRKAKIPKPSPWAKKDDGAYFKAALLSGPPGVGKTTTVSLVCKELGFDTVELNASDTRNKTLIREQVRELLTTNSLAGYAKGDTGKMAVTKKHVLVMDEVDGMAGNEDRGGLQELIGLIKTTSVPIICMCNDRQSEKMRTLVNYCYDLKFSRPRVDQIKSAMLSVCFKEGIKVPPDVLSQLIVASNQDVRQTLNSLSMWAADPDNMTPDQLRKDAQSTKKDLKLGSWEAVRKVFSAEDHKSMSINDKSDLFFYDYSIAPLFVQENYLSVMPHCPKEEILDRISQAADSISFGDLVDKRIRSSQAWSLLPLQAMYASVIPGSRMSGHVTGQISFPGWLGNNSRHNKMKRLACEIHAHTRLSATGSKSSIHLDYCTHLRDAIITPLVKERTDGISRSLAVLQAYNLLREDLDSLNTLALWPRQQDPMILIDSKVKAAMTRAYNKSAPALPHAAASFSKSRRGGGGDSQDSEEYGDAEELPDDGEELDDDPEHDALIKVKKKTASAKSSDSENPSTSKGDKGKKGKGKK